MTRTGRLVAALVAAAVVVVVVSSLGAKDSSNGYEIRLLFKNATGSSINGDVRVAGANVGTIKKIYVDKSNKASVIVSIVDPAFQRFYADAKCRIRLQSLIGEKYIDCDPGTSSKPELLEDPTKEGRRLMSDSRTGSPVDVDQLLDEMREPQRERFRIIINELGITLTGRGQDLADIIHDFSPTFKEIDDVLKILAKQNKNLEILAAKGDRVADAFADSREEITGLFKEADKVQRAVNTRRQELADTFDRLPAFLDELLPTARRLKEFSLEAAPIAKAARKSGKDFSTFVSNTAEFADASNKGLKRLGESTETFRSRIPDLMTVATDLNRFAQNRSTVTNIRKLLTSFEGQGGYENLATMTIGLVGASNGFDSFGHFLRSGLILNGSCLNYNQKYNTSCAAAFTQNRSTPSNTELNSSTSTSASSSSVAKSESADAAALDYLLGGDN